jgi:hypothetical protein
MSYDINVLVNGNKCRQYLHNGRTYVEAKEGSEYALEIKNNSWEKILAVVSVDGLNVVDGETAKEGGSGYVLDRYTSQKLYGFQYSKEKVATFKFGHLGATDHHGNKLGYAASKGDGSEKNAGVIGFRIWDEKPQPKPIQTVTHWHTISMSSSYSSGIGGQMLRSNVPNLNQRIYPKGLIGANVTTAWYDPTISPQNMADEECQIGCDSVSTPSFDMETQWGETKSYKVKETTFNRNEVIHSIDIYYASRESLIAMGIDLGTERRVSFPESFQETKYAQPPKGWKG